MSTSTSESERKEAGPFEKLAAGGSTRIAAEQLLGLLRSGLQEEIECRLDWLTQRLDAVAARVDEALDGRVEGALGAGATAGGAPRLDDAELNRRFHEVVSTVLLDSGLLAELVTKLVDRELSRQLGVDSETDGAPSALERHVAPLVTSEVSRALSSDAMKQVVDEKFRAVTHYLRSEVIPKAVRQALSEA